MLSHGSFSMFLVTKQPVYLNWRDRARWDSTSRACDSLLRFQGIGFRLADSANLFSLSLSLFLFRAVFIKTRGKVSRLFSRSHEFEYARYPTPPPLGFPGGFLFEPSPRERGNSCYGVDTLAENRPRIKRVEFDRLCSRVFASR